MKNDSILYISYEGGISTNTRKFVFSSITDPIYGLMIDLTDPLVPFPSCELNLEGVKELIGMLQSVVDKCTNRD